MSTKPWHEYSCVECGFRMLLPPDDDRPIPPICPDCDCLAAGSLMYQCSREVGRVASWGEVNG